MNRPNEQSLKAHIRQLSKEQNLTFAYLWQNLVLERFLARLNRSEHHKNFILKGGSMLAHYINLGRETKDLDFLVQKIAHAPETISAVIDRICSIDLGDTFFFERLKTIPLSHPHMHYTGVQVALLARLEKTKTHLQVDLGFGDIVQPISHSFSLTASKKGPLFEEQIQMNCYPKEFIFAEKLETMVYRGSTNSRMKDFHDIYSLIAIPNCLNRDLAEKAITEVFNNRGTPLTTLPLVLDQEGQNRLQLLWSSYLQEQTSTTPLPAALSEVLSKINNWLNASTSTRFTLRETP